MSSLQKKETLLIVDDSKFQRVVIRQSLGEHFNFAEAVSGEECLTIMEKESDAIDLVLLDLVMPGIDGFEVLRRRQNMEGFKDTPVIVLTNTESVSSQSEAFALGADEFIIKPVDTRIALTRINNTLGVKRRLQNSRDEQKAWKTKSQIDEMTSLFNKMTVEKLITKTLTEHENGLHALMVIDIDNFKSVNDVYGHTMGDHVISVIAGVISSQFRSTDYVGRMGGDEFAVLMGDIPSKEIALIKAENLVNLVKYKESLSIPENISISVGIAFSDPEDHCYYDLSAKADQALYVSKKSGKGRYSVYGEENHEQSRKQLAIVWSGSRNVTSMIEFALPDSVQLKQVDSVEMIRECMEEAAEEGILALVVDVSEEEDQGQARWQELRKVQTEQTFPTIAICREGNLKQMKNALETDRQVLETMKYLNHIAPFGIKLQLLHILKNTDLAKDYEKGIFEALTPEHYLDLLVSCLAHLSPDIVIHRVTGDGPKDLLIAPKWSLDKRKVLNSLHHRMKEQGIRQGDLYEAINKDKH